jgi:hypothetical protein
VRFGLIVLFAIGARDGRRVWEPSPVTSVISEGFEYEPAVSHRQQSVSRQGDSSRNLVDSGVLLVLKTS